MRRFDRQHERVDVSVFGMHCRFTAQVLTALINAGHRLRMVVLPRQVDGNVQVILPAALKPRISMMPSDPTLTVLPNVAALAWSAGAALVETGRDKLDSLPQRFSPLRSGVIVSACFPWRLPAAILEAPDQGCLNVHPSLLPRHRGPDPLFWAFHAGDQETGVSIHRMTSTLDAGPVLLQERIPLPLQTRYRDAETQTIELGAKLIVQAVQGIASGVLPVIEGLDHQSAYEPHPRPDDLVAHTAWTAERAFRFVHGVGPDYGPLAIQLPHGDRLQVVDASSLHPNRLLGAPMKRHGRQIAVQFSEGVVICQPASQR